MSDKHNILSGTKFLRENKEGSYSHKWSKVFITPDLTRSERIVSMKLKKELEKRRTEENNPNLIIFRGQIVERSHNTKAGGGEKGRQSSVRVSDTGQTTSGGRGATSREPQFHL